MEGLFVRRNSRTRSTWRSLKPVTCAYLCDFVCLRYSYCSTISWHTKPTHKSNTAAPDQYLKNNTGAISPRDNTCACLSFNQSIALWISPRDNTVDIHVHYSSVFWVLPLPTLSRFSHRWSFLLPREFQVTSCMHSYPPQSLRSVRTLASFLHYISHVTCSFHPWNLTWNEDSIMVLLESGYLCVSLFSGVDTSTPNQKAFTWQKL